MQIPQAMLFDFDDTLVATRTSRVSALIKTAADFGYRLTPEDITEHWGKPFNQLVMGIVPGVDYEAFHRHYADIMRQIPSQVLPGTRKLLAGLSGRGVPIFVISSGSRDLVRQDLEEGDLWQYLSKLWGYEDTPYHKPDPRTLDPVLRTLAELGIDVNQVVYIGDSVADFRVATAKGFLFCAVLSGTHTREDFRALGLGDELIVDSLEELLDLKGWLTRVLA